MKTLKFLLIAFILVSAFYPCKGYAKNSLNPVRIFGEPCKQSKINWRKPSKANSSEQRISICFVVDDHGNVTEVNVKTNNQKTKRQIEKQYFSLRFKDLEPCVINCVDVVGR